MENKVVVNKIAQALHAAEIDVHEVTVNVNHMFGKESQMIDVDDLPAFIESYLKLNPQV